MDTLGDVVHPKFKYILIPEDIADNVLQLEFEGKEKNFRLAVQSHLAKNTMKPQDLQRYKDQLRGEGATGSLPIENFSDVLSSDGTYQIVPLTLPTQANGYIGINAYVDNVGKIKELSLNARATRIANTDIYGDCFVSKTFDDEQEFKRLDYTVDEFEKAMSVPYEKNKYQSQAQMQQLQAMLSSPTVPGKDATQIDPLARCESCYKKEGHLQACGGCHRVSAAAVNVVQVDLSGRLLFPRVPASGLA